MIQKTEFTFAPPQMSGGGKGELQSVPPGKRQRAVQGIALCYCYYYSPVLTGLPLLGYLDLRQLNCWHKTAWTCIGIGGKRGRIVSSDSLCCHPWSTSQPSPSPSS